MRSIRSVTRVLALAIVAAIGLAARAEAIPIISVTPVGNDAVIELSNVEEPIGAFYVLLNFDDVTLNFTGHTVGAAMGVGIDLSDAALSGAPVELNFTSTETQLALAALQGNPAPGFPVTIVLATAHFDAPTTNLTYGIVDVELSNNPGTALVPVCIAGQPCRIPEPGLLALLTAGVAAWGVRRRVRRPEDV